jgi:hypothetical protein
MRRLLATARRAGPIDGTITVMQVIPVVGGRYQATCSKCERTSVPVPATNAETAVSALERIGWTERVEADGGHVTLCPKCSKATPAAPKKGTRRR